MRKTFYLISLVLLFVACGKPIHDGNVTAKDYQPAYVSHDMTPIHIGHLIHYITTETVHPERYRLKIETPDGKHKQWKDVDVKTYYQYNIGDRYSDGLPNNFDQQPIR